MTRGQRLAAGFALVALACAAFAPGLTTPFIHYDDNLYVWDNLKRLARPGWEGLLFQWSSAPAWGGDYPEYFPLRDSVYWGLYQRFGLWPVPYHVISLVFHVWASLAVWRFLRLIGLDERGAWLGGLLFALHPVHIESVVWVSALKDPMFTAFMMTGLAAYASHRHRPAAWKYLVMMLGLVAASLTKSLAASMPLVLLAMELLLPPRAPTREVVLRLLGPFAATTLFMLTVMGIGKANYILVPPHGGSWASHLVIAAWAQVKYLEQAFLPTSYRLVYCFEPPTGLGDWRLGVAVAVFAGVGALAWRWRREPLRLFFLCFYAAAMLPVANLVPFPAIMADRYLYAPSVATCGLLGLLASSLSPRTWRLITAAAALALTGATAARVTMWHDEEALWEEPDLDPACVTDTAFAASHSHVLRYLTAKDPAEKLMAIERAMISPGFKLNSPEVVCTTVIGATRTAQKLGDRERALGWAKMATRMCPADARAWNAAMALTLHERPELAAGAATRAHRLKRTVETEVLMWLTMLELGDARAPAEVTRLARLGDQLVCEKILQFSQDVPRLAPSLGAGVDACARAFRLEAPGP